MVTVPDKSLVDTNASEKRVGIFDKSLYKYWIFGIAFLLLYIPVVIGAAKDWLSNDNYSHGFLVLPCSLFLVWLQRDDIKKAIPAPTIWGIIPLGMGLLMQMAGYILQIKYVGMWSIVPTIAGAILLLHGPALWRICWFPTLFTLFAAPLTNTILYKLTGTLQTISTIGSTSLTDLLGYSVVMHGNVIDVPGATLEIANACSGFHSIISILAFISIYGYLFTDKALNRIVLIVLAFPVAIAANILRISVLILAANYGGMHGYHMFHDPAALAELLIDFVILVSIGRSLGCDSLRFAPQSAA
jgi:exosortase